MHHAIANAAAAARENIFIQSHETRIFSGRHPPALPGVLPYSGINRRN
jgi:hypothetical protein